MSVRTLPLPPLDALRTFHAVATERSFSKAARRLHVTQGAVSHRIRGLEENLGRRLFRRGPRRVDLTPAGEILFAAVSDALARLNAGLIELERLDNDHTVSVSCSPSFAIRWLVPRLGALRAHEPDIDVRVAADDRLVEPGTGGVDLCIRFGAGGYSGVEAEALTAEDVHAVCSPLYATTHGLDRADDVVRGTLLHADALSDHPLHIGWSEWLAAAQLPERALHSQHFSHAHMALEAATAGQGIALGRTTITADAVRTGRLRRLDGFSMPCGFAYWLLTSRRAPLRPPAERFVEWLHHQLEVEGRDAAHAASHE